MAGFGENLRREREMRGISLQEISDSTKVSVRLLQALEDDDFAKLPGGIFIRSFIRAYANYLGLDEEQVMAEYQRVAPAKADEDFSRLGVTGVSGNGRSHLPVLPWVIAVILLAGGYAIFKYSHRNSDAPVNYGNPPATSQPASPAATSSSSSGARATPVAASTNSGATPAATATNSNTAPASSAQAPPALADGDSPQGSSSAAEISDPASSAPAPGMSGVRPVPVKAGVITTASAAAPAAPVDASSPANGQASTVSAALSKEGSQGELVLQVAATERAWVSVKADGKTVLQRVLNPNDVRTLTAKDSFDVLTGNAQGTVLTLNGTTLQPLGRYGEVKSLHLTRDDLKK